jgi:hypothetical protein
MTFQLRLQIAGLCGIVRKADHFEVWMVDAQNHDLLRLNADYRDKIDDHVPRIFVHGEQNVSSGPLTLQSPAYACKNARQWKAASLAGWDGVLTLGSSGHEPMRLASLHLTKLRDLTGGRGGSAVVDYTASVLQVKLGLQAVVAVKPWLDPVLFAHVAGGFMLSQSIEIRIKECEHDLKLTLNRRGQQPEGYFQVAGREGQDLLVLLRNEAVATGQNAACPGERDFAAHCHVLADPGSLDPWYPYPTGFFEAGAADDAQCSPVEYQYP